MLTSPLPDMLLAVVVRIRLHSWKSCEVLFTPYSVWLLNRPVGWLLNWSCWSEGNFKLHWTYVQSPCYTSRPCLRLNEGITQLRCFREKFCIFIWLPLTKVHKLILTFDNQNMGTCTQYIFGEQNNGTVLRETPTMFKVCAAKLTAHNTLPDQSMGMDVMDLLGICTCYLINDINT